MSEIIKTPFEQARYNINSFAESADMMHSLAQLQKIINESKNLSEEEQDGINMVVEAAIKTLSRHLVNKGEEWN